MNLAALGSIAGGIGTGLDQEARRKLEQIQAQAGQTQAGGQELLGSALSQFYGGQPPQAQPPASPLARIKSLFGGGAPSPPPQTAGPPPPAGPPPAPAAPPTQAAASQPQGAQPPQMPPQTAALVKQLDFPSLVQLISKMPGATPAKIGSALTQLEPMMNAQALQQWRMTQTQLAPQRLAVQQQVADTGAKRADTAATQGQERIDISQQRESRLAGQFKESMDVARDKLKLAQGTADVKQRQAAIVDAEREVNRAQNLIQNETLYGGSDPDKDAKMKGFQTQLDAAKAAVEEAKRMPTSYEGQDKGRAPPETVPGRRLDVTQEPDRPKPAAVTAPAGQTTSTKPSRPAPGQAIPFPDGTKWTWNGKEPYNDPANWQKVGGDVGPAPRAQ